MTKEKKIEYIRRMSEIESLTEDEMREFPLPLHYECEGGGKLPVDNDKTKGTIFTFCPELIHLFRWNWETPRKGSWEFMSGPRS